MRLTTLPTSCAVVVKSGNLNFQEASGPLQASNGTALILPFIHSLYDARNAGTALHIIYTHSPKSLYYKTDFFVKSVLGQLESTRRLL